MYLFTLLKLLDNELFTVEPQVQVGIDLLVVWILSYLIFNGEAFEIVDVVLGKLVVVDEERLGV